MAEQPLASLKDAANWSGPTGWALTEITVHTQVYYAPLIDEQVVLGQEQNKAEPSFLYILTPSPAYPHTLGDDSWMTLSQLYNTSAQRFLSTGDVAFILYLSLQLFYLYNDFPTLLHQPPLAARHPAVPSRLAVRNPMEAERTIEHERDITVRASRDEWTLIPQG